MNCFFFIEFFLYLQYLLIRCTNSFYQVLTRTYILQLFKTMRDIHFIFHVFLFESYKENEEKNSLSLKIKKEKHWKIEMILNNKLSFEKLKYFVRWLKYFSSDNMWLKASKLVNVQKLIQEFHEKYFHKSQTNASRRKHKHAATEPHRVAGRCGDTDGVSVLCHRRC